MKSIRSSLVILAGSLVLLALTLTGCGGGGYGSSSSGASFAPAAFSLSAPADLATGVTTTPTLSWTSSLYASSYRVQIDTVNTFTSMPLIENAVVAAPTMNYTVPAAKLAPATVYFWRVIAENAYGQAIAGPRSFTP